MQLHDLQSGLLVKRYKRFLADVLLPGEPEATTVHCPNTGSMKTLLFPDTTAWISRSDNPQRRLAYTLEILQQANGTLAAVNTSRTNRQIEEAFLQGWVPGFATPPFLQREVTSSPGHRIDFCLQTALHRIWVEVKNVTMIDPENPEVACFPDAVTTRGTKHLHELIRLVQQGDRAIMLFAVNRSDAQRFQPAQDIDPVYAQTLSQAVEQGVEICVLQTLFEPTTSGFRMESRQSLPWEI